MISGTYPHNHHIQHNSGTTRPPKTRHSLSSSSKLTITPPLSGRHTSMPIPLLVPMPLRRPPMAAEREDLRNHEGYMHARGFTDVHETTGPGATPSVDSYLSEYLHSRGLYEPFVEDMERRKREGGHLAVWPSPLPEEDMYDSYVGARAAEWLETYDDTRPFCLWVGFPSPHEPWDAPGHYATLYDPDALPPPLPAESPSEWLSPHAREKLLDGREHELTTDAAQRVMANYGGKVSLVDDWIGRLLGILDARGMAEDTLVVFWSDHGEMGGDHGLFGKRVFYEFSVHVPLIMRWPAGLPAGTTTDALTEHIDLFDTVVDAAGAPASRRSFGRSLLPHARGEAPPPRDAAFSEFDREIMMRTERYKYAADRHGHGFLLHDMVEDPHEQRNLVGHPDYAQLESELRERLLTWLLGTQVVAS